MAETFPVLQTERLNLVEITQEHLDDLFKIFGDKRVTEYYNVIPLTDAPQAQKFIDWFSIRYKEKSAIRWGINLKERAGIIGTIGFNNFTKNHRANIGFDLQHDFWNKGYTSEALQAVTKFGFQQLDINRIEAEVMQGNTGSEKLLEKSGFKFEGILRDWMFWNDKHYDMSMFSKLRSEFSENKSF